MMNEMTGKLFIIGAALLLSACSQPVSSVVGESGQSHSSTSSAAPNQSVKHNLSDLFSLADAEKILGEQAHLTDSSTLVAKDTFTYKCSYTSNAKDEKTNKTGVIYFMMEEYAEVASAQKSYTSIKKANENHGIKVLNDMGDEAYFHTDNENFYFILSRKGSKMLRMKVNKVTGKSSLSSFNSVARKITEAM
jgi:hypothetical protein